MPIPPLGVPASLEMPQVRRFALTHGVRTKRIHGNRLYYLKADWDEARKVAERKSASTKAKREPDNESDNN